ncbi:hypothetical protein IKE19_00405 [Candidatus Saccharibacteria bacterium]|nr:hypothetical protein [Candidatus Saccharibacteria bacterium]
MDNKGSSFQPGTETQDFFTPGVGTRENTNPDILGSINTDANFVNPNNQNIGSRVNDIFSDTENVNIPIANSEESLDNAENIGDAALGNITPIQAPTATHEQNQKLAPALERKYDSTPAQEIGRELIREFNGNGNPVALMENIASIREHYAEAGAK